MTFYTETIENESVLSLTSKNLIWAIIGAIIGLVTNKFNWWIELHLPHSHISLVLQFICISAVLATTHKYFKEFGLSWQNSTPGLFFVSVCFGVQFTIFQSIQNVWNKNE